MYCCFSRDLSLLCSMLKCTSLELVAVKTLMGIDTRPNEMVPEEIARAGMALLCGGCRTVRYHRPRPPDLSGKPRGRGSLPELELHSGHTGRQADSLGLRREPHFDALLV